MIHFYNYSYKVSRILLKKASNGYLPTLVGRGLGARPSAPRLRKSCCGAILHTKIRGWVTVARALEMATELFTAVEIPTMELALYLAKASMSTVK